MLKESGVGIPDLLVVFYDVDPQTRPEEVIAGAESPIAAAGFAGFAVAPDDQGGADRLGAILTSNDHNSSKAGSFELTYDDSEFQVRNAQERRPDLLVQVLAPEAPGQTLESRVLYVSTGSAAKRREDGAIHHPYSKRRARESRYSSSFGNS